MTTDTSEGAEARKDPVASIAGHLTVLSTGEHAMLRRMYLTGKPAVDGAVIKLLHYAEVPPAVYNWDYPAWRLLTHIAAVMSGTSRANPHFPQAAMGAALYGAKYSENRTMRLTAARGPALHDQIALAGRFLAKDGKPSINLWTLLHLAGRDREKAEAARVRIARDYYAAAARSEGDAK